MSINESSLPLQRLWYWERQRADEIWLTQPVGGGHYLDFTWAQAVDQARRMAAHLKSFGWEPGSRVAIMAKNSAWWLLAEYAIWMAGHVSVPIYPSLKGESVRFILEHSQARGIFLGRLDSDDWSTMRGGIPAEVVAVRMPLATFGSSDLAANRMSDWSEIMSSTAPLSGQPTRPADDLALIVYTSGTTGVPKGVMHSFGVIANALATVVSTYGSSAADRLVSYLPLAHIADRMGSQANSLGVGCRVFFTESPETFAADLRHARPTIFGSVPRLWTKFRQGVLAKMPQEQLAAALAHPQQGPALRQKILAQLGLDAVRLALCGAAPLPQDLYQWYLDLGLDLCEMYGMTENFAISHMTRPGKGKHGYIGQPMPGVTAKLSESGELLIRSPGNMLGYYKDPQKTLEAFTEDGFLRTGDVGTIDAEGYFRITGRAKEQFKTSKGKYVAPTPIENRLAAHPEIEACCVTGVAFPQPFAILMLGAGQYERHRTGPAHEELTRSLRDHLAAVNLQLDPHEQLSFLAVVPDQWTVENGFVTPTLKIKRSVIESHYQSQFPQWAVQGQAVLWC